MNASAATGRAALVVSVGVRSPAGATARLGVLGLRADAVASGTVELDEDVAVRPAAPIDDAPLAERLFALAAPALAEARLGAESLGVPLWLVAPAALLAERAQAEVLAELAGRAGVALDRANSAVLGADEGRGFVVAVARAIEWLARADGPRQLVIGAVDSMLERARLEALYEERRVRPVGAPRQPAGSLVPSEGAAFLVLGRESDDDGSALARISVSGGAPVDAPGLSLAASSLLGLADGAAELTLVSDDNGEVSRGRAWSRLLVEIGTKLGASAPTIAEWPIAQALGDADGATPALAAGLVAASMSVGIVGVPRVLIAALRDGALPGKLRNLDEASLGLAWIARRGLLSLLRASLRWHARPLVQVVIEDDLPDTLPALLGELTFAKDGSAQELASREAVIAEGQRMRHCVGSYWEYCVLEGMRIFHLVDANANTATAAFAQSGPAPTLGFSLEQLNGPSNQAVGAPLKTLAQRVLAALNDDALRQARRDASEEAFRQAEHEAARRENRPVMAQPTLDRSLRRELRLVLDWSIRQAHWLIGPRRLYAGHIAGFNYTEGPHLRQQLAMGDSLILVREPDNPHDERAVRIDWQGHKLGYIPRAENAEIARRLDAGDAMAACITLVRSESARWAEVLVDVWMAA